MMIWLTPALCIRTASNKTIDKSRITSEICECTQTRTHQMLEFCSEFKPFVPSALSFSLALLSSFSTIHTRIWYVYQIQTESQFISEQSRCVRVCVFVATATPTTTNRLSINFPNVPIQLLLSGNLYLCNVLQHHFFCYLDHSFTHSLTQSLTHASSTVEKAYRIQTHSLTHTQTLILYRFKSNQNEVSLTEITWNVSLILHFVWNWIFFSSRFGFCSFRHCVLFFSAISFSSIDCCCCCWCCCWFVLLFVRRLHVDDYDEKRCCRTKWVQE